MKFAEPSSFPEAIKALEEGLDLAVMENTLPATDDPSYTDGDGWDRFCYLLARRDSEVAKKISPDGSKATGAVVPDWVIVFMIEKDYPNVEEWLYQIFNDNIEEYWCNSVTNTFQVLG